jgi:hypothetical protein
VETMARRKRGLCLADKSIIGVVGLERDSGSATSRGELPDEHSQALLGDREGAIQEGPPLELAAGQEAFGEA